MTRSQVVPTRGDATSASRLAGVQALIASGARRALQDIELALSRIADGGYGRCRVCDMTIPLALLRAVPQTTTCLSCLHAPGDRR